MSSSASLFLIAYCRVPWTIHSIVLQEGAQGFDQFRRQALGFFIGRGADMAGNSFGEQCAGGVEDAEADGEANAAHLRDPEFDCQQIIVAGRAFVGDFHANDREGKARFLKLEGGAAEASQEFAARAFQDVEVAGVIDVVADRAFGVNHTVRVSEN